MSKVKKGVFTESELEKYLYELEGGEVSKAAINRIVNGLKEKVKTEVAQGKRVELTGLVIFEGAVQAQREGRNPATGEALTIPAKLKVKATASKKLSEAINANESLRADYLN